MTKKKENTLTVKQSIKLDFKLTDVKTGLQTLRNYANTLLLAKHAGADNGLLRYETDNFLETVFDMIEIYSNELDMDEPLASVLQNMRKGSKWLSAFLESYRPPLDGEIGRAHV